LKHDNLSFVGSLDFFRIKYLKEDYRIGNDKLIDILNYIKRINSFPNGYLTYRIMLIIQDHLLQFKGVFQNLN